MELDLAGTWRSTERVLPSLCGTLGRRDQLSLSILGNLPLVTQALQQDPWSVDAAATGDTPLLDPELFPSAATQTEAAYFQEDLGQILAWSSPAKLMMFVSHSRVFPTLWEVDQMRLVMNFLRDGQLAMGEMVEKYHGNRAADVLREKLRLMEVERVEAIAMLQAKIFYVEAAYSPWGRNVLGKQQIFPTFRNQYWSVRVLLTHEQFFTLLGLLNLRELMEHGKLAFDQNDLWRRRASRQTGVVF